MASLGSTPERRRRETPVWSLLKEIAERDLQGEKENDGP